MDHRATMPQSAGAQAPGDSPAVSPPASRVRGGAVRAAVDRGCRGLVGPRVAAAAAVLVVQAGLSARLVGADTAFQDEAEYLWAGHLQWSHWLHGT